MDRDIVLKRNEELLKSGEMTPVPFMIKTECEILGIIEACKINKIVLDKAVSFIKEGVTSLELDNYIGEVISSLNAKSAILNYDSFEGFAAISVNDCVAHGLPSNYEFRKGDVIKVDSTIIYNGYYADSTRCVILGENKEAEKALKCLKDSIDLVLSKIVPFKSHLGDIGYYIYKSAKDAGFDVVVELLGHGVGNDFHEEPFICHKALKDTDFLITPNMVFTIEPIFTLGSAKIKYSKDGQSIMTKDKSIGVQIEYTVLILEDEAKIIGF